MITDDTIDLSTAKFWCIFSDKALQQNSRKIKANESIINAIMLGTSLLFTATGLINMVSPYLKNLWKKMKTSGKDVIAKATFEADGTDYKCTFDIKSMKWNLTSSVQVDESDIIAFFKTQFFSKFKLACQSYIEPLFQNKEEVMKSLPKLGKEGEFLKDFIKNERRVRMNMFEGKYNL